MINHANPECIFLSTSLRSRNELQLGHGSMAKASQTLAQKTWVCRGTSHGTGTIWKHKRQVSSNRALTLISTSSSFEVSSNDKALNKRLDLQLSDNLKGWVAICGSGRRRICRYIYMLIYTLRIYFSKLEYNYNYILQHIVHTKVIPTFFGCEDIRRSNSNVLHWK